MSGPEGQGSAVLGLARCGKARRGDGVGANGPIKSIGGELMGCAAWRGVARQGSAVLGVAWRRQGGQWPISDIMNVQREFHG